MHSLSIFRSSKVVATILKNRSPTRFLFLIFQPIERNRPKEHFPQTQSQIKKRKENKLQYYVEFFTV